METIVENKLENNPENNIIIKYLVDDSSEVCIREIKFIYAATILAVCSGEEGKIHFEFIDNIFDTYEEARLELFKRLNENIKSTKYALEHIQKVIDIYKTLKNTYIQELKLDLFHVLSDTDICYVLGFGASMYNGIATKKGFVYEAIRLKTINGVDIKNTFILVRNNNEDLKFIEVEEFEAVDDTFDGLDNLVIVNTLVECESMIADMKNNKVLEFSKLYEEQKQLLLETENKLSIYNT